MANTKISALGTATLPLSPTDTFVVVQSMGTVPVSKRVAFSNLQTSLTSGTYSPTLYNTTNVAASTAYAAQYMRVGNVVTVSGLVDIDATAATATVLGMSLPIASNLSSSLQCRGVAACVDASENAAAIVGDAANDRALIQYTAASVANVGWSFMFTYLVV